MGVEGGGEAERDSRVARARWQLVRRGLLIKAVRREGPFARRRCRHGGAAESGRASWQGRQAARRAPASRPRGWVFRHVPSCRAGRRHGSHSPPALTRRRVHAVLSVE